MPLLATIEKHKKVFWSIFAIFIISFLLLFGTVFLRRELEFKGYKNVKDAYNDVFHCVRENGIFGSLGIGDGDFRHCCNGLKIFHPPTTNGWENEPIYHPAYCVKQSYNESRNFVPDCQKEGEMVLTFQAGSKGDKCCSGLQPRPCPDSQDKMFLCCQF